MSTFFDSIDTFRIEGNRLFVGYVSSLTQSTVPAKALEVSDASRRLTELELANARKQLDANVREFRVSEARLREAEAACRTDLEATTNALHEVEAERTRLQAERTRLQAEQTCLQAEQTCLQAERTCLQAERTRLLAERTRLQAEIGTVQAALAGSEARLQDTLISRSWKMTRPYRAVGRLVRAVSMRLRD